MMLEAGEALAEFSNVSPPLAPQTVQKLFRPDLSATIGDDARAGLGFGLYIARAIAQGHGGDLAYSHDDPFVTLTVRLPLMPA